MQVYSCAELMSAAHALGGRVDFESGLPDALPVLAGWQKVQSMDSGLVLYLSRSQDMVGGRSQNCLPAGLTASFLLQGQAEVVIANQRLQMDSRRAGSPAMLVHLREEEAFQRHWQAGREETKVSLHLSRDWLSRQLDGIASAGLSRLRRCCGELLRCSGRKRRSRLCWPACSARVLRWRSQPALSVPWSPSATHLAPARICGVAWTSCSSGCRAARPMA
ncbi:TPA: hypothetical protein ACKP5I_002286 [Stenotrophomonas maltophilia]